MRLFTIKNQPDQKPYGEIVLTGDDGQVLYDIVYDGKGYGNYPDRLDGDFRMAESQLATYGAQAMMEYLEYLKRYYNMQVVDWSKV